MLEYDADYCVSNYKLSMDKSKVYVKGNDKDRQEIPNVRESGKTKHKVRL